MLEITLNFGPRSMKLAPDSHFPKTLTVIEDYWAPAEIDGDMAVFLRKQMAEKVTKLPTFSTLLSDI